ncbi:hypothetical protein ENKNEFLB_02323 [Nocardioides aquaticus]|uniref:Activator of Hsp90 ATPase homologue 1/2-like C-terminal domain-containing protein n=1 Tax=Nocardioides aquaticus TaxID=160826 RepID=A0ABX8EHD3_9ACTN|nr:SRPBCC domain-containing protein [Nocardioides aquaticus]QVT79933.1 hypothetical protein ENKNEFLB_02323 [Nocardioides aquaticus]
MTSATGRREVRQGTSYVVYTRTFVAPIHDVWAAVTEPERLERWIGTWTGDPVTGEVDFYMTAEGEDVQPERYRLEVCTPPTRLVARTWADEEPDTVWHLELDLAESESGVTTLTFAQAMTDPDIAENVGPGWDYYLDRLVGAERGEGADSVHWDDYYPALADHYRREFGPHPAS